MSVVLSINSVETGHSRNGSKRSRGFSFRSRDGLRFISERVKHDSALSYKGTYGNTDLLSDQLLNASVCTFSVTISSFFSPLSMMFSQRICARRDSGPLAGFPVGACRLRVDVLHQAIEGKHRHYSSPFGA